VGYEYRILKPKDKTWFDLGKGDFARPLKEFARHNTEQVNRATTSTEMLLADRYIFTRSMMAQSQEEFVELYIAVLEERQETFGSEYVRGLANKLWNWFGDDEVWIYGDHAFEVYERKEWRLTGSRYTEKCSKCHRELDKIFQLQESEHYLSTYCEECYYSTKSLLDRGLVRHSKQVCHSIRIGGLKKPRLIRPGSDGSTDHYQRLREKGWHERPLDMVEDATHLYKDNKKCTVFSHPSSDVIVFEYTLTLYITKEELSEIKRKEEEEYQRKRAHNEKYKDDPSVLKYVFIEPFEMTSRPVVPWGELKFTKFNVIDRAQQRARQEIKAAEVGNLWGTGIFIDGKEQK
jgi:hypothetical protein